MDTTSIYQTQHYLQIALLENQLQEKEGTISDLHGEVATKTLDFELMKQHNEKLTQTMEELKKYILQLEEFRKVNGEVTRQSLADVCRINFVRESSSQSKKPLYNISPCGMC
jgi:uncharacterized coiled-coil protein SlyX